MFSGSFNQTHFGEVTNLLHTSKQSGVLIIFHEEDSILLGSVYFHEGQLVHASAENLDGLDAINQICNYSHATFSFELGVTPPEQSLITYPTDKLLDKVQKVVLSLGAFQAAIPLPSDVPVYQPGKSVSDLQATPSELALLIQCRGKETIRQIASRLSLNEDETCQTLGKFQQVGMIITNPKKTEPPNQASLEPALVNQTTNTTNTKTTRYWRGKRIS